MDNYTETGTLSFKVETSLTFKVNTDYKYIKDVADGKVEWDTVGVNTKEGPGTYSADTHVYVSFGFGLKKCLEDQTITFNPRGLVTGPQERKPRKPRILNVQPMPAHTPAVQRKIQSSRNSERNKKFHKIPPAQKKSASLVRHTDMAQRPFNCVQTHDTKTSSIKKSTLANQKVYHGLLNENTLIDTSISNSVYEISIKM